MAIESNENSLQKRFSSEDNDSSERAPRATTRRDDNILSSDDYTIGKDSIEYTPKRRFTRSDDGPRRTEKRSYTRREDGEGRGEKRSYTRREDGEGRGEKRSYTRRDDGEGRGEKRSYTRREDGEGRGERRPYTRRKDGEGRGERRPYTRREDGERRGERRPYTRREDGEGRGERRPYTRREDSEGRGEKRPYTRREDSEGRGEKRSYTRRDDRGGSGRRPVGRPPKAKSAEESEVIRLNKFIADAGVCSRREADTLITAGSVKVNGEVVDTLGAKIKKTDKVQIGDETLHNEKLKYLLLNKPKGYITTMSDPQKRNTVLQLIDGACKERLFPVGRLDRNTTGLLLFTNDGELANKLMHPKSNVTKIYYAELDKPLTKKDMQSIAEGVELEDGFIAADTIDYDGDSKKEVGIEIHSGKNHIVKRIFEHFGYEVVK
ncbi:MAG: pseudouridine synthase, partial [Bacteroidales bacterium]|nr:pseudouridine synthase [Bacteroidales bacterium]